jgi:short-subunit dehydrogenase
MTSRHALVTGASSGLGREFVRQLVVDHGMTVLATARRLDRLQALASELPAGRVIVDDGDLSDPDFRNRLWEGALALPGGLDLLVNNAGVGDYSDFADQDPAAIRRIVELNLVAVLELTQKAIRHMRLRGSGEILQVSSVLGFVVLPESAVYVATKHAINGLVKSLRYELRRSGVRVWAACPGRTESEFSRVALGNSSTSDPLAKGAPTARVVRQILRRLGGRAAFVVPGFGPQAALALAHWLPGPFEWIMARWVAHRFRAEIRRARASGV